MHELSIALSILDLAEEEAGRRSVRIAAVHVKLGPLSGVVKEALVSAYELAREGTPLEEMELTIKDVPIIVHCSVCDADCTLSARQPLCCLACGAPTNDIVSGRELEVTALEIEP